MSTKTKLSTFVAFITFALIGCKGEPPPSPPAAEKSPLKKCQDLAFGMRVLHGPDFERPAERVSTQCLYAGQSKAEIADFFKKKVNSAEGSIDELLVMTHIAKYINN